MVKEAEKMAAENAAIEETPEPEAVKEDTPPKKKGRQPLEGGKSLQRLLIFVSSEDLVKMKDDGRPLSTIGREAIKDWLEKNGR